MLHWFEGRKASDSYNSASSTHETCNVYSDTVTAS